MGVQERRDEELVFSHPAPQDVGRHAVLSINGAQPEIDELDRGRAALLVSRLYQNVFQLEVPMLTNRLWVRTAVLSQERRILDRIRGEGGGVSVLIE